MDRELSEHDWEWSLDYLSSGFLETLWETLIALTIAAAICISVIGLSSHLKESRTVRGTSVTDIAPERAPGVATSGLAAQLY